MILLQRQKNAKHITFSSYFQKQLDALHRIKAKSERNEIDETQPSKFQNY